MRASDFIGGSVREAKRPLPQQSSLQQKSFSDVSAALGKGKTTALLKHPWFLEYGSYDKAYKHGVDRGQFHEVEVYPYMDSIHRNAEGKVRPTVMLRFHFSDSAKISQVHKFMRDKEPGEEEKTHPGSGWRHVKSWKKSDINEGKTTISQLYSGNYPDRDETFWDYVRPDEFDTPLEVKTLPKHKLRITLQGQYRVEHLDEILDMMDEGQRETLERYMGDPHLSNKIILLSGDRIIDGNHRALAAAMRGVPINYVDLADLDGEDLSESKHGVTPTGYTWSFEHGGEVPYKSNVEANTFIRVSDSKGKTVLGVWADVYSDDVEIQYSEVFDKKLRGKGIYTDFLKGLAKHYNIISDQDQNNAARNIYKKLGADYNRKTEKHTLRRSSQSVAEDNVSASGGDYAIHLGNLKRFFKAEDPLEELVPERGTHYYALHSDIFKDEQAAIPWRRTFASLTGKDFKEVLHNPKILGGYRPKKFPIPPGTLVGDMHLANLYYSKVFAKTPEEKQEIARQYKESLVPLELADLSKYKKPELLIPKGQGVAEDTVDEMALSTYKTMGDFTKQGPFTGADKKLVPHHKNIEKATQFFEQTPYDFRLFFSNIPGTGKYSEHGPMTPDELRKVFGKDAEEIIDGSSDAITVVYVGNKGDRKVMLTPWMMAHRFGHALNRGAYKMGGSGAWKEAERHFFRTVNSLLNDYYGKIGRSTQDVKYELTPEYNALFNAVGTQRSSRSGEIRRPYEFFYELFAQYLGTGKITLNPFPTNLTYGRKAWGNPTRYMNIKPEYRDETERKYAAEVLGRDMEILFDDVLSSSVGQIYVM